MCSVATRRTLSPVHIPEDVTVSELILERLQIHSERDRIALIDGPTGHQYSYRELLASICNVGNALLRRGFQKGDILCIISPNCCQYPMALHGVISIGGAVTTCNPQGTMDDMRTQLEDCGARWIVTSPENIVKVRGAVRRLQGIKEIFSIGDARGCTSFSELTSDVFGTKDYHRSIVIDPKNDVALLLYSSGTTGKPKGILRTHYTIVADMYQHSHPSVAYSRSPGSEVYLAVLPFFHAYGCMLFQHYCLLSGDTVVVYPRYTAATFVNSIQLYKVNVLIIVPPIAVDITRRAATIDRAAFASVHTAIVSATTLSPYIQLQLQLDTGIRRVQQVFGMTETGTILMPEWNDASCVGTVGIPACNTECKVVDHQTGAKLGPHQDGELLVRGPSVMKGYLNRSSADDLDADHWLHTGDMAHYDETGRFYIVDRYKQLVKYNGYQVIPSYLENLLLTHPAVADAGVIGVPDERAGELPAAFVVLKAGVTATEADIKTFVDEKVAPYNKLRGGVTVINKVPRSPSGKMLRRALKDEALRKLNAVQSKL